MLPVKYDLAIIGKFTQAIYDLAAFRARKMKNITQFLQSVMLVTHIKLYVADSINKKAKRKN